MTKKAIAGEPLRAGADVAFDDSGFSTWLAETASWVEAALNSHLKSDSAHPEPLYRAMRHALLGGGKRLRPAVVRALCEGLGGKKNDALDAAMAVELIHTYSLVHDDLPCMDDDELRRGRPTVHVLFDEGTAVLVGDALQALAFEVLAGGSGAACPEGVVVLARAAGADGLVGGQVLDLSLEAGSDGSEQGAEQAAIQDMHARKTAAMFRAAAELGALSAGSSDRLRARARRFGELLGLAFQAVDDLLDVTGDVATLGKTPGKDKRLSRPTLVAAMGFDGARSQARRLIGEARLVLAEMALAGTGKAGDLLEFVLARTS